MREPVIEIEKLSKQYHLGQIGAGNLSQDLNRWWAKIRGKDDPNLKINENKSHGTQDQIYAVKDITLRVHQGEVLGIIGKNGAGKSTLLKLLSKVTAPSSGKIKLNGKIASLLEVGTGFHPELTGQENIYLNGAILGMSKEEIKKKFDAIVAFSGIGQFINTPVKRYSSGMYVRLAFAVAAHLEPDILIVDEVLAVGDWDFQRKCLGKMSEVAKGGRTILFVSHNLEAISTLTSRCIVLKEGEIVFDGDTNQAIKRYIAQQEKKSHIYEAEPVPNIPSILKVEVKTSHENNVHYCGKPLKIYFEADVPYAMKDYNISFVVVNDKGYPITWRWLLDKELSFADTAGRKHITCTIPNLRLYKGHYHLTVNFGEKFGKKNPQKLEQICPFEVVMYEKFFEFDWASHACVYFEDVVWSAE